jgi:DNA-binding transcriptional MerR regulator
VPTLTVAAVARRLGVAPATLRTWDRRYRLGPSAHSAGSHRRYTGDDVARLLVMRGLTLDGVSPSEAARIALAAELEEDVGQGTASRVPRLVSVPGTGGFRRTTPTAVVDAVLSSDERSARELLELPAGAEILTWWTDLVEPARVGLAFRTVLARPGEDPDAMLHGAVLAALRRRSATLQGAHVAGRPIVLLLAAPGETRPVTMHVLAAALADRSVDARLVAGPIQAHRLLEIAAMTTPGAVVVLSEARSPQLAIADQIHEALPALPMFLAVSDESAAATLPWGPTVHRARSLPGMVHEVLAVCR